ncbi:hypothetical protein L6470_09825 [Prevotella communis]|uniref:hypothetical protein n=1 Tax=Prevotella communis TaxID=2913614 RepID=UPI001EDA285D|nr:hypothetical protein [Prevotella communis]UKK58670.1 hypothetical protein L6470_09825 [Prevotella communis]
MEMENLYQQQSIQKLDKAYTFFMVPFFYKKGEWEQIYSKYDKWIPVEENLYKEDDVLYSYIMDVFNQEGTSSKSHLNIYRFKSDDLGANSKTFADRILGKQQLAVIGRNAEEKSNPQMIPFKLLNEGNYAPHLFVSLSARVGLLTFSIELTGESSIDQQIGLNYFLHKRNETNKYQCVCMNPDKPEEAVYPDSPEALEKSIPKLWKMDQKNTRKRIDYICWNLNDFVDCILCTMGEASVEQKRICYFSRYRMHLFSFSSIQDINDTVSKTDIIPDLLRLSRCVNAKYMLPFDQMIEQGAMLQTYENIFFSSSIEGTAMMCIGKKNNSDFIANIYTKFNRQYLLIYILVLLQRYTLQSLEQRMTDFESTDKLSDKELWNLIDVICKIKTNCYYTDVSIYTHHSQFYHLCCINLHIPETFNEVGEKINLLKLTTDRRLQRIQEKSERLQKLLNIVVALLTIAQVMQAVHELSTTTDDRYWAMYAGGICLFIIVIAYIWSYYRDSIFNKFN